MASGKAWGQVGCLKPTQPHAGTCLSSEGSVIAYYWSKFSIPQYLVEEAKRALAQEQKVTLPPRARSLTSFELTSVVAFRECRGPGGGHISGQPLVEQEPTYQGTERRLCLLAGPLP